MLRQITLFDCLVLVILYCIFFYQQFQTTTKKTFLLRTIFYIYICVVIYFTLLPFIPTFDAPNYNLIPFRDVIYSFGNYWEQLLYNVLLFIPFGFLLPIIKEDIGTKTILIGFFFSLCIEISQPWITINRVCDITDLITNTCGTCIGYISFLIYHKIKGVRN